MLNSLYGGQKINHLEAMKKWIWKRIKNKDGQQKANFNIFSEVSENN